MPAPVIGPRRRATAMTASCPGAARIRFLRQDDVPLGSQADAFYSFFQLQGEVWSVHRRFNLDPPSLAHSEERYRSLIVLTRYRRLDDGLHPHAERILGAGEDPRVVSDGTQAYVLSRIYRREGQGTAEYRLFLLPAGREHDIVVPPGLKVGKNWQPFIKEGRLFAVHGFSPLTILELRPDGEAHVVHQQETAFGLPAPHDGFTMVRGGSNGLVCGDSVVGLGHLTVTRDDHRPFVWVLDAAARLTLSIPATFFALRSKGFNIVDPTSLLIIDGELHLGLCASEREWFFGQRFLNLLIRLPCSEPRELAGADSRGLFDARGDLALSGVAMSRTFIPRDLPHQLERRSVQDGVESQGQAGCLLHGPYLPIESSGRFLATLAYRTGEQDPASKEIGRFEVCAYRDGKVDVLAGRSLSGTAGAPGGICLEFTTDAHLGWLLETRVFAAERTRLTVLSIRVLEEVSATAGIEPAATTRACRQV